MIFFKNLYPKNTKTFQECMFTKEKVQQMKQLIWLACSISQKLYIKRKHLLIGLSGEEKMIIVATKAY